MSRIWSAMALCNFFLLGLVIFSSRKVVIERWKSIQKHFIFNVLFVPNFYFFKADRTELSIKMSRIWSAMALCNFFLLVLVIFSSRKVVIERWESIQKFVIFLYLNPLFVPNFYFFKADITKLSIKMLRIWSVMALCNNFLPGIVIFSSRKVVIEWWESIQKFVFLNT